MALRRDNGVVIHQGASKIYLAPDELTGVLGAIHKMTGQCSPMRAGKTADSETALD